jgi:hypothetical protein
VKATKERKKDKNEVAMFFYICYQLKIPKQRKSISQPFVLLFWIF